MRFNKGFCWLATVALLLASGCATRLSRPGGSPVAVEKERREQQKLALSLLLERQIRIWRVGNRLRRAGADFCGDNVRYTFGFFAVDRETFSKDYQKVAGDIGLGSGLRIWEVLPDLESSGAQIKKGDEIVELNDVTVSDFKTFEKAMKEPFETGELSMKLIRAPGKQISVSLKGGLACDYRAAVVQKDSVNAFVDGKNVFLTTGMVRFTKTDDEIALVLGHEFAHNALGHLNQMKAQAFAGLLLDLAVAVFTGVNTGGLFSKLGQLAFAEDFEADADYMGLYMGVRAGYDIQIAPNFWRRMAVEHPGSIKDTMMATHPSTPERAVVLKETIDEINEKIEKGVPLLPEKKEEPPTPKASEKDSQSIGFDTEE
jgi:hypothetical protein